MDSVNEICTDKTSMLTANKMTVMMLYAENRVINGQTNPDFMQMASYDNIMRAVIYNSTANIANNI